MVFSDVNYLSTSAPPAASEWSSLLRPLRGREPEGMWNLLSIVREMYKRNDRNAVPLLSIITDECLNCEQVCLTQNVGVTERKWESKISAWEAKSKASYWNNTPGQRQAFIKYSKKRTNELLLLNKKDLRTLFGLYTGHCPLKYYLYKLGRTNNATCRLCKGADETAEHILCICDSISLKRLLYLGKANLTPEEVVSVAPRKVLNLFGSLELH